MSYTYRDPDVFKRWLTAVIFAIAFLAIGIAGAQFAHGDEVPLSEYLQRISVTVTSDHGSGSGVIVTKRIGDENVSFVLTAAHVVAGLRSERRAVVNGQRVVIVDFQDAEIRQELHERGRKVGEARFLAQVVRYSDPDDGEDLALLLIRKRNFVPPSVCTVFVGGVRPLPLGTRLYHVGSLLGPQGSNSMTDGILSQTGRVIRVGHGDGVVFDQVTCTAFPGSSGGGVFVASGEAAGACVGLVVRGAGEGFTLIVPARRVIVWAARNGVGWLFGGVVPDTLDEALSGQIDDRGPS